MWSDFLDEQWPLHLHDSFPASKCKDVLFLRNILDGFFVHGRDHAITHTNVFCPLFTWQVYKATFGDTQVYEMLSLDISQAIVFLQESTRQTFLKNYSWGVNLRSSSIPIAYLLLKRKKMYRVARPIISYNFFIYARLFRATSIVLDLLIRVVCPQSFGLLTLPHMLTQLTTFLQNLPVDFDPEVHNQDLIGFFTSIPVSRILSSVSEVVQLYISKHRGDIQTDAFSVRLCSGFGKGASDKVPRRRILCIYVMLWVFVGSVVNAVSSPLWAKFFDSNAVLLLGTRFPPCSRI
eukprot:s8883_g1.t1